MNILQVFTIDFSEIQFIVNHKSQSDGQNKSAKSGMNLQKKTRHIISPEEKKRYQGQWFLTVNKEGKNGPMKLRSDFRAAVLDEKSIVYTTNQENQLRSVFIQVNKDAGIHLQAHRGGTSLNGIGSELTILFEFLGSLFVAVGFVHSR